VTGAPACLDEARAARLDSFRARYPRWRIWHDDAGWHAMRRGSFRERPGPDVPVHSLHMPHAALLAVHLAAEDALECGTDWRL
jgi:hypothetical protein